MAPPTRAHVPLARALRAVTTALLPPHLRAPFGLRFEPRDRAVARITLFALRPAYRALPRRLREVPAYVEASRRVRGEPPVDPFGRAVERLLLRTVG